MSKRASPAKASGRIISVTATPPSNITTIYTVDRCSHSYSLDCSQ